MYIKIRCVVTHPHNFPKRSLGGMDTLMNPGEQSMEPIDRLGVASPGSRLGAQSPGSAVCPSPAERWGSMDRSEGCLRYPRRTICRQFLLGVFEIRNCADACFAGPLTRKRRYLARSNQNVVSVGGIEKWFVTTLTCFLMSLTLNYFRMQGQTAYYYNGNNAANALPMRQQSL